MAVTSFVLGLVGWIVAGLGSLVGLILGIQSLRAIDRPGSGLHGRGLAIAGIVLGCLGTLFGVLVFAALLGSDVDEMGSNNFDEVLELQVGDCYDEESGFDGDPSQTFTAFVEPRACGDAHDAEVYALVFHPSGPETPYPGEGAVVNFAQRECAARFEDFVGSSYDNSSLDIFYLFPQKAVWTKLDDRRVVCSVYDVRGDKLVGSMRGSRR